MQWKCCWMTDSFPLLNGKAPSSRQRTQSICSIYICQVDSKASSPCAFHRSLQSSCLHYWHYWKCLRNIMKIPSSSTGSMLQIQCLVDLSGHGFSGSVYWHVSGCHITAQWTWTLIREFSRLLPPNFKFQITGQHLHYPIIFCLEARNYQKLTWLSIFQIVHDCLVLQLVLFWQAEVSFSRCSVGTYNFSFAPLKQKPKPLIDCNSK